MGDQQSKHEGEETMLGQNKGLDLRPGNCLLLMLNPFQLGCPLTPKTLGRADGRIPHNDIVRGAHK